MDSAARDVTDEAGTKGVEVTFDVEATPDALLRALWSPANFARLFPDLKETRVIAEGDDGTTLDVAYRVNAVVREVSYTLRRTLDRQARTIEWREIGGDLRRVRGGWRIDESSRAGSSRVTYRAFVDIGRFVPTAIIRETAKRKLGEMVERIRNFATEL